MSFLRNYTQIAYAFIKIKKILLTFFSFKEQVFIAVITRASNQGRVVSRLLRAVKKWLLLEFCCYKKQIDCR